MSFLSKILFLSVAFVSPGIAVLSQETNHKWAVVEFSANFMREAPDYTAELGDQALMGTVVEILDKSGYWVKIKRPEPYTAWVNEMGLVPMVYWVAALSLPSPEISTFTASASCCFWMCAPI